MRENICGEIIDNVPFIPAMIEDEGLSIDNHGTQNVMVDTGFTGDIAIPLDLIRRMGLSFLLYEDFELANGEVITHPVFLGRVLVGGLLLDTLVVPGEWMIGMTLLGRIGDELSLDFRLGCVMIRGMPRQDPI